MIKRRTWKIVNIMLIMFEKDGKTMIIDQQTIFIHVKKKVIHGYGGRTTLKSHNEPWPKHTNRREEALQAFGLQTPSQAPLLLFFPPTRELLSSIFFAQAKRKTSSFLSLFYSLKAYFQTSNFFLLFFVAHHCQPFALAISLPPASKC